MQMGREDPSPACRMDGKEEGGKKTEKGRGGVRVARGRGRKIRIAKGGFVQEEGRVFLAKVVR